MASRAALFWATAKVGLALGLLTGCAVTADRLETRTVYERYAQEMTARGRFREEFRPTDAVYTNAELVEHFDKVVFLPEAANDRFRAADAPPRTLSKWAQPIRYAFDRQPRASDATAVSAVFADFNRYGGLSASPATALSQANLKIYVLDAAERAQLLQDLDAAAFPSPILRAWIEELELPCFGLFRTSELEGGEIVRASIFVKDELSGPFRRACFVEELSQALGLTNDHDDIRPSIFNDDQEFIALTEHDSFLIRLLYHPRMRPGMTRDEAVSVARELVGVLRPEPLARLSGDN